MEETIYNIWIVKIFLFVKQKVLNNFYLRGYIDINDQIITVANPVNFSIGDFIFKYLKRYLASLTTKQAPIFVIITKFILRFISWYFYMKIKLLNIRSYTDIGHIFLSDLSPSGKKIIYL